MVLKTISPGSGVQASLMLFYYATIAYHVELNAVSDSCRQSWTTQEKLA